MFLNKNKKVKFIKGEEENIKITKKKLIFIKMKLKHFMELVLIYIN